MIFVQGHKGGMDAAALAVASQHIAQQSCDVVAAASSVRATTRGAGAVALIRLDALIRRDALTCCDVVACALMSAHKAAQCCTDAVERALASAHKAAQCIAEAARAIASQHEAQQSLREVSPQFEFRYL